MQYYNSHRKLRHWGLRQFFFGLWLTLVTAFTLIFSFAGGYSLQAGSVAPQDIRSPRDITYVSAILSDQAQVEAERRISPIYTSPDPMVTREQLDRTRQVLAFLSALRSDPYASEAQKYAWILAVPELQDFPRNVANVTLSLPEANWSRVQLETLRLLDQVMRQEEIREMDLEGVHERIPALVPLDLAQDEANVVAVLAAEFLRPNVFYDESATVTARQMARENVGSAFRTLRSGEIIVREGSVVNELDVEALTELGLTSRQRDWFDVTTAFLLAIGLTLVLGVYLFRLQPEVLDGGRQEGVLVVLLTTFLLLARLLLPSGELLPYLFPGAAMSIILVSALGRRTAVGATLLLGAVSGWIAGHSLDVALLVTLSGLVAALSLPRYEHTGAIFRSGLFSGLASIITLLAFSSGELRSDPLAISLKAGVALVGGLVAGGLSVGGLFLLTPLFDLTTTFRLIELSRPNHPLLQRLLREAPATFNHVMMVASLAEQAAERIGANALLTRVGAYYHDIGKLVRPYFFIENQQGLSNPHDRLDAYTSVDILIGHIRDGMKMARQYRLPAKVRAFVPEHHGTMRASFFYQKAVEAAGGEAGLVEETQFHYPGPTPQSRETLLVMLADGSEAATRARRPATPEELAETVDFIFQQRMDSGQLDGCPITMQELHTVKETYIELLRGAFHPRVKYPEPKQSEERKDES